MSTTKKLCMSIAALALSLGTVPAPAAGPADPVKNIVLVHGASAAITNLTLDLQP